MTFILNNNNNNKGLGLGLALRTCGLSCGLEGWGLVLALRFWHRLRHWCMIGKFCRCLLSVHLIVYFILSLPCPGEWRGVVFGCLCSLHVCLFVRFVTCLLTTLQENSHTYHHETFRIDGQWQWDHTVIFARWQHPAMGCKVKIFVSSHNCDKPYVLWSTLDWWFHSDCLHRLLDCSWIFHARQFKKIYFLLFCLVHLVD